MKTYPVEFRERVIALTAQGMTGAEIAKVLGVSGSWVNSIKRLHRAGRPLTPTSRANKRLSLAKRHGDAIRARIAEHPGTTLEDLQRDLNLDSSIANIWYAIRDLGLSLKKKTLRAAERDRPDVAIARSAWRVVQAGIDPQRLVFLDETFGTTTMTRWYGWGPTDQRVIDAVPHGHWKTTTFVVALRLTGLFAPMVVDGALNGELFVKYVRQELAPRLRPGDILVMDNLQTHKTKGVLEAITAREARVLYLPPYSPDLNPIELAFSKVKNELRRRRLRTMDELWNAFGESLDWFTPIEAKHYFQHAGYPAQ
jgi:transposase